MDKRWNGELAPLDDAVGARVAQPIVLPALEEEAAPTGRRKWGRKSTVDTFDLPEVEQPVAEPNAETAKPPKAKKRKTKRVRRGIVATTKGLVAVVVGTVVGLAAAVYVVIAGFGGYAAISTPNGVNIVDRDLQHPLTLIPAGSSIAVNQDAQDRSTLISRLLNPIYGDVDVVVVNAPHYEGRIPVGYDTTCVSGGCTPGEMVVVPYSDILTDADNLST